jgi:hypothetical protein
MKYIARNNPTSYTVCLNGDQEEQKCFCNLAHSLYNISSLDSYQGQIVEFPNKRKFEKFLMWQKIFGQCSPKTTFNFSKFARNAVAEVRQVLSRDLVEVI